MANKLKIEAPHLKLELTGSALDIEKGYAMTREVLMQQLIEQFKQLEGRPMQVADQAKPDKNVRTTKPLPPVSSSTGNHWSPNQATKPMHISVAFSSDFYNKVCLLERVHFDQSELLSFLTFEHVQRLYIRHNQKARFSPHFTVGKVLWRELTAHGRSAVRSEG